MENLRAGMAHSLKDAVEAAMKPVTDMIGKLEEEVKHLKSSVSSSDSDCSTFSRASQRSNQIHVRPPIWDSITVDKISGLMSKPYYSFAWWLCCRAYCLFLTAMVAGDADMELIDPATVVSRVPKDDSKALQEAIAKATAMTLPDDVGRHQTKERLAWLVRS